MPQKNLIHLHPSISYLGRCLSIVKSNSQNIIIHGASIHTQENKKFLSWLNKHIISNNLNTKLMFKIFKFELKIIFRILNNFFFFKISRINKYYSKDIILDSICRRKSSFFYYNYPFLKKFIKLFFWIYFRILTSYYLSIIEIIKPNNIIISHPVYVEYGSLLIAGTESNINIIVISGAFHNSYIIKNKFKTYHCAMFLKYIYKKYNYRKNNFIYGEAKNSIINDKKIKIIRPFKDYLADTLLITTHCFSDNNHISDTGKMLYESYYEWFKETCKILNKIKEPTYKNYIIKIHPYIKIYKEEGLIKNTIKKYIKNKKINLIICNDDQNVSDFLSQREISLINITVHGQICAELGTMGVPSIACGIAQGPIEAQFNPKNLEEYKKIILNNKYATNCLSKLPISKIILEESIKYLNFSKFLLPNNYLKEKLYQLRNYYNFQTRRLVDENLLKILLELKRFKKPKELILKNGWGVFLNDE